MKYSNRRFMSVTILPPDTTLSTRAAAKVGDVHRMQSVREQSPEEKIIKENAETRRTTIMIVAGVVTVAVFLFIWWLAVH
jgi:hypothetical protein